MNRQVKAKVTSFLTITLVIVVPAFAEVPDGVSPGAADRTTEIEGRCPTFIWDSVPGAAFHELVGYRIPENSDLTEPSKIDLANAAQVLYAKVPGSAPAWEPELAECLTPGGNYVWFVRAVYLEEEGEVAEASEWSNGKYFSISSMPSTVEVEEAVRVLRRYAGNTVDPEGLETERADTERTAPSRRVAVPQQVPKSVTSAKTAIKGTVPDATGETYGVVGISNSPNGAGLAAANTNGGADLVIDGSADNQPDAVFTQAGIDRASPSEQWFSLINSDTGVLSLTVEGTIAGNGSGLIAVDADKLDGTDGADFATDAEAAGLVSAHAASGDHDGQYIQNQTGTTQSAGFRISGSGRVGSLYVDGSIAVYNGAARVVSCPSGMNYVETNLCIDASARSAQYYWVEAVSVCRRSGYHMCTYSELDQVLCHENLYSVVYNPYNRWIGNFVGDDTVLCGNSNITGTGCQSNFDGHCNKNTSSPGRQYWCCLSLGNSQ